MSSQFRTETCILVARQYLALDVWIETSDDRSLGTSPTVTVQHTLDRREQRKKVAHARAVCDEVSGRWAPYFGILHIIDQILPLRCGFIRRVRNMPLTLRSYYPPNRR